MDNLMLLADMPGGFWQSIIGWFGSFITNYGLTIIVFTIALKLILSPLDFYQRYSMRKTQRQQALLKPELDKINQKYGHDKNLAQQKQMELYKRNGVNPASGCLPMLIYMIATMVIFFSLFSAMNGISQFKIEKEYQTLQQTYVENYVNFKNDFLLDQTSTSSVKVTYNGVDYNYYDLHQVAVEEFNANKDENGKYTIGEVVYENEQAFATSFIDTTLKTVAQDKVLEKFNQIKEGFLWIKNVFRPDNYSSAFPNYSEFIKTNGHIYNVKTIQDTETKYYYHSPITDEYFTLEQAPEGASAEEITQINEQNATTLANAKVQGEKDYNEVTLSVQNTYRSWNGYFILVILAAVTTLLGQLLGSAGSKAKTKQGEVVKVSQPVNKVLLVVMPALMVWFTWGYSSLFALYIITNSLMSILIGYLVNLIITKIDLNKKDKDLVKISFKDNTTKERRQIKGNEIATQDYRIQKKGAIVYEQPTKKSKKQNNLDQDTNKSQQNEENAIPTKLDKNSKKNKKSNQGENN